MRIGLYARVCTCVLVVVIVVCAVCENERKRRTAGEHLSPDLRVINDRRYSLNATAQDIS